MDDSDSRSSDTELAVVADFMTRAAAIASEQMGRLRAEARGRE